MYITAIIMVYIVHRTACPLLPHIWTMILNSYEDLRLRLGYKQLEQWSQTE
jgi:hypothetical protein